MHPALPEFKEHIYPRYLVPILIEQAGARSIVATSWGVPRFIGPGKTGHVTGELPGEPSLSVEVSTMPDTRVYRLVFRQFGQHRSGGFDFLEREPAAAWRTIRILLPNNHEYVIHSIGGKGP